MSVVEVGHTGVLASLLGGNVKADRTDIFQSVWCHSVLCLRFPALLPKRCYRSIHNSEWCVALLSKQPDTPAAVSPRPPSLALGFLNSRPCSARSSLPLVLRHLTLVYIFSSPNRRFRTCGSIIHFNISYFNKKLTPVRLCKRMSTLDASAATFKIPHMLFDIADPVPRTSNIPPTSMRAMNIAMPRRRQIAQGGTQLEAPSSGYKEYMLFALRTRITPELQALVGRGVVISYTGYPAPSLRLSLAGGDREPHINETIRSEIDAILKREAELPSHQRLECLLLRWNAVRYLAAPSHYAVSGTDGLYERIPSRWLRSIMPFVPLDETIADDNDIPVIEHRIGGLYADCLHSAAAIGYDQGETYGDLYARLAARVLILIRRWYDEGRLVDPEQSLVRRWRLEAVKTVAGITLYKPSGDWGLTRMTRGTLLDLPVSALLHDMAKGRSRPVAVRVGINLVDYHAISQKLFGGSLEHKYHFAGGALHFTPRDLDDLLRVLDGVDEVLYGGKVSGAVVTLTASRLSWIKVYALVVQRAISANIAVYVRRDVEPVFVFSFTVPVDANIATLRQEVVLRARRLLVYLLDKLTDPTKVGPTDIHALLDEPTTELPEDLSSPTVRSYLTKERPELLKDIQSIQF